MNAFTPRISGYREARNRGFVAIAAVILINDVLAVAAMLFVYGGF